MREIKRTSNTAWISFGSLRFHLSEKIVVFKTRRFKEYGDETILCFAEFMISLYYFKEIRQQSKVMLRVEFILFTDGDSFPQSLWNLPKS